MAQAQQCVAEKKEKITLIPPGTGTAVVRENPEDNEDKIKKQLMLQVSFYFGNKNYYTDMTLLSNADSDRWIPISLLPLLSKIEGVFVGHGITDPQQQQRIMLAAVHQRIGTHPINQTIELHSGTRKIRKKNYDPSLAG